MQGRPNRAVMGAKFAMSEQRLGEQQTIYRSDLLEGQRVIVSGGGSGIGKCTAFLLARLGAQIAICGRAEEKLSSTAAAIEKATGREVLWRSVSIRDPEAVEAFVKEVDDRFGGFDHIVNNAGGQYAQNAIDLSRKGWAAVIDTNLNGTWWMMQESAKLWRDRGTPGNIVNIACTVERGCPQMAHTCASRAGVIYLSKTLAVEWAPLGIRVNSVAVGATHTEGYGNYPEDQLQNFNRSNTLQRSADPFEMAEAIAYLCSPAAGFVTGSLLTIDGGQAQWGEAWLAGRPEYFAPPA